MKKRISNIIYVSALVGLFACEGHLDTMPDGDTVTSDIKSDVVNNNPDRAEASVNAVFAQFNAYMPNYDAIGSRHNDFGYPSIMLFTDTNGNDVVCDNNGYNWTGNSLEFSDREYASNEGQIVWNDLYSIIYNSNNVIGSIPTDTEDATSQFYLAQGLAARAFCYLNLAQLYQFNYEGNQSEPCVPIITEENSNDASINGIGRSTVEEVYTQIESDITAAIALLESSSAAGVTRADKRYIDLSVAYGISARTNLAKHNYASAASDAGKAIEAFGGAPASIADVSVPTFTSVSENNWMWGVIVAETDAVVTSGIVNWPSHMGSINWGYALYSGGRQVSTTLFNSIPDTDVRKGWWTDAEGISPNLDAEQQAQLAYYAPYTHVKFGAYNGVTETSTNASDIVLMRVEEMYLIQAEATAMSGGDGKSLLENFVQTYRDPSYTCSATSAEDVQEEVFQQRRVELWGEGLNWFDIMRLNKGVDRRGAGYPNATMVFNIEAGSDIMLWVIPEAEIQANPGMTASDNNPLAVAPSPVADTE